MLPEREAYLMGFLQAARLPGRQEILHRDIEVVKEIAEMLNLDSAQRQTARVSLHHPERGVRGAGPEAGMRIPPGIAKSLNHPLAFLFERYRPHQVHLERGILEGCGTLCYKRSTRGMGISFTSDDADWIGSLRAEVRGHHPCGPVKRSERGRYWFGIADHACRSYASWLYGDCTAPHSRSKRDKLKKVLGGLEASSNKISH